MVNSRVIVGDSNGVKDSNVVFLIIFFRYYVDGVFMLLEKIIYFILIVDI